MNHLAVPFQPLPTRQEVFYDLVKHRFQIVPISGIFRRFGTRKRLTRGNQLKIKNTLILSPVSIAEIQVDHVTVVINPRLVQFAQTLRIGDLVSFNAKLDIYHHQDQVKISVDKKKRDFQVVSNFEQN